MDCLDFNDVMDTVNYNKYLTNILTDAIDNAVVAQQISGGRIDFLSEVMDNFIQGYCTMFEADETAAVLAWERPVVQDMLQCVDAERY